MLNYINRDIKIQKNYLYLLPLLILFLMYMETPINVVLAVAMVYIPVNAVYLLAKSNINHFDLTLPYARKDIVNYRYMSTFVYAIVGGALVALILKAIGFDVSLLDLEFALQSTLWLSIVFFPLNFALTTEKALLISIYVVFSLFMIQTVFLGYAVENVQQLAETDNPFTLIIHIGFALACVLFAVSWLLSLFIIKRKDI